MGWHREEAGIECLLVFLLKSVSTSQDIELLPIFKGRLGIMAKSRRFEIKPLFET